LVAATAVVAVAAVGNRDSVQWWQWWGHMIAAAALVAKFNNRGGIGRQHGNGEVQTQQLNQGDDGGGGQHWVSTFNHDNW
jgi:hypothetical protein